MKSTELTAMPLTEAAEAIRSREISPIELTEAYLGRIEKVNPEVNAYVTVTAERARTDARQATEEIARGNYRGALHGIPLALKDLFDTAGIRTTAGSKFFADHVPAVDSTAARRLREAGSVLLGKLATHEFAYGVTTNNPHFGPTRNPWDLSRIPGGSSGGSGAAIAAGLAATTLGTDTGGSIRIPSSLCGAVGLKPTYGRVSKAGVFPLSYIFDHPGPIARRVADAAVVLEAIAGYDPADAASARVPVDAYVRELGKGVRGLRVGVPRRHFYDRLDGEVAAAVEAALGVFSRLGAEVRDVDLPSAENVIMPLFGV
ncbi:MAG: amidase, partial [Candidatus Binatia bacterium]